MLFFSAYCIRSFVVCLFIVKSAIQFQVSLKRISYLPAAISGDIHFDRGTSQGAR